MGFLSGRVSFVRFQVGGKSAGPIGENQVEQLERFSIANRSLVADGVNVGFCAGDHILDLDFNYAKNVINDSLHAAMRVDQSRIPGELKQAYYEMELAPLAAENPTGYPTKRQKAEAKAAALERVQQECKDGRHQSMKATPFLWDSRQEVVYFAASSDAAIERFTALFQDAFGRPIKRMSAGTVGADVARELKLKRAYDDISPANFSGPSNRNYEINWLKTEGTARDFLGNEFLLWLWWVVEEVADTIKLSDDSSVTCMMTRTLVLECPLAETGKESISHESPVRLPEAKHAVRLGKLPRKSGLILIRHDEKYELTFAAETLGVSGASLPKLDAESRLAEYHDRIDQIRHLTETLDLLFGQFIARRLSSDWPSDLRKIRSWLKEE